jgi:hypothetical protein
MVRKKSTAEETVEIVVSGKVVCFDAHKCEIPEVEWPRLKEQLRLMLARYGAAEETFGSLDTKREKIKQWEDIKKVAGQLKLLLNPARVDEMVAYEKLLAELRDKDDAASPASPKAIPPLRRMPPPSDSICSRILTGRPSAETRVRLDLAGVANLQKRARAISADFKARPENKLEKLASTTAAKFHITLLTWHMARYWQEILKRPITFGENTLYVKFARAVYSLAEPRPASPDDYEMAVETIRSRYETMKRWRKN